MPDALDRLAAAALALADERRRIPAATYRLQMHGGFPLTSAAEVVPYLDALGVSHAYSSSLLAAKPGSVHGYDVMDPGRLNPEIGTEDEFAAFAASLRERGMGLILDTVPNHMSVGCDNPWWLDVLEHGPSSPYAGYFDITWNDLPRPRLNGKVLLPVLGEPYGQAVDSGKFVPGFDGGAFHVELYGRRYPIDPRTYTAFLTPALDAARADPAAEPDGVLELQSIQFAVENLPPRAETDPAKVERGRVESVVVKRRLAELGEKFPMTAGHLLAASERMKADPGDLDALLEAQAYRACFWRVASDEINYRRFFDVNDLAALATEREEVFRAVHGKIMAWLAAGYAGGLRIDHPDGLFNPKEYLERLQSHYRLGCAKHLFDTKPEDYPGLSWAEAEALLLERFAAEPGRPLYVVVEKILGLEEPLPPDWATDGTTGYEFLNAVGGLFVDPARADDLSRVYEHYTGRDDDFDDIVFRKKFLVLQSSLNSELHFLAAQLDRLAQAERWSRDLTANGLRHALRVVITSFPVYRTYLVDGVSDGERRTLLKAMRRAKARNPLMGKEVFNFIRDTLLLKDPPSGPASPDYREAQRRFAGKFEQVTAPVMAKGLEDTAFYVYNRLASLNEVGGDPAKFGRPPAEVHQFLAARAQRYPGALSPLSTHDTKRGEDVRARLNVLSEMPAEWGRRVSRWAETNRRHKVELEEGVTAPDPNEEYLLYQTLVGAWPVGDFDTAEFTTRITDYMHKALHEAKEHTSWINPDAEYDAAVATFVGRVLDPDKSAAFLSDLRAFAATVGRFGFWNSLAQTLVRCAAPGVPDTYQGTELWDYSLVDPDNRRPVDYRIRANLLRDLDERAVSDSARLARELTDHPEDGRAKLFAVSRTLRCRRQYPAIFATGGYVPVAIRGAKADHAFAFLRTAGDAAALVIVPRLVVKLSPDGEPPIGEKVWGDTTLLLPASYANREWRPVYNSPRVVATAELSVGAILKDFPIEVLIAGV